MDFKYKDFLIIANNQALVDFSSIEDHCINKNIIHINKAIHFEVFKKYGKNNYLAMNSYLHSKFIAYSFNQDRFDLFSGIYFIFKPANVDAPYDKFQTYIDECNHKQKESICIGIEPIQTILKNADPSAGFHIVYHLFNTYKDANITLVGFCGNHKLPNNKIALAGHSVAREQLWYKSNSRILSILDEKPCTKDFNFPCRMCNASSYEDSLTKCFNNE